MKLNVHKDYDGTYYIKNIDKTGNWREGCTKNEIESACGIWGHTPFWVHDNTPEGWHPIDTHIRNSGYILLRGDSGYLNHPHFIINGRWNESKECYVDVTGEPISDNGWHPAYFREEV